MLMPNYEPPKAPQPYEGLRLRDYASAIGMFAVAGAALYGYFNLVGLYDHVGSEMYDTCVIQSTDPGAVLSPSEVGHYPFENGTITIDCSSLVSEITGK